MMHTKKVVSGCWRIRKISKYEDVPAYRKMKE